jgi:hypothetical protein
MIVLGFRQNEVGNFLLLKFFKSVTCQLLSNILVFATTQKIFYF